MTRTRSVLVEDGKIASLSAEPTQRVSSDTLRLDARGGSVLPGLIDSHCHPTSLGEARRILDLSGTTSVSSIRLRLFARAQKTPPGEWIVGRGWDQELLTEKRYPKRSDVDDVVTSNPILLRRICGHAALVNTRAMREIGIDENDFSLDQRLYERDSSGTLTGILREGAVELAASRIPAGGAEAAAADIMTAEFEAARSGLTTLHSILSGNFQDELEAFGRLTLEGKLNLRYRIYVPADGLDFLASEGLRDRFRTSMLRICGVKIYADGSLGARTAALREPYSDDPGNSGLLRHSSRQLRQLMEKADSRGHQVMIHAIGDRGIEESVDAIEAVSNGKNSKRHRVEHCSVCDGETARRLQKLGVGVSVQPQFIVSDAWAEERLGPERVNWLYPLRTLLQSGVNASGSSDAPVEPISPLLGMWASMVRGGFAVQERIGLPDAVRMYTQNAAINGFDDDLLGTVREGAAADLTVLDSDIDAMHPALLRKVGVAATIVNGRVVFSYEGAG